MSIERYGSYDLIKRLATGGMAQLYLAREQAENGSEKLVVVKRILSHLAENLDFVRMFLDEARIAARLNHPNIVQIFNLGAQDDSYFLAMEYIHGEDVRRISKTADQKGRALPHALVARIIAEACAGLDYAHKKADAQGRPLNIVHRDVSPQNILVSFDGKVKVVDFGIAKAADQATVTRSGVLKGKYSYMSPEQAAGRKLDRRSDIFALGVVLWELLTKERLFKRANEIQTLTAVGECKVSPPSVLAKSIPPELDAIVLTALSKTPEGRFQDAAELRGALEKWCATQPKSSTADLAAFMRELFSERLVEEARSGHVFAGEDESPKAPRRSKAPPPEELPRTMLEIQGVQPTATVIPPSRSDGAGRSERRSDPSGGSRRSQGSGRRSNGAAAVALALAPVVDPPSDLAATAMAARTISEPPKFGEQQPSLSDQATKSVGEDRK
ncbi:MAG: serine/threonine protein kinase, partial [Myxococcaceae bacterium]